MENNEGFFKSWAKRVIGWALVYFGLTGTEYGEDLWHNIELRYQIGREYVLRYRGPWLAKQAICLLVAIFACMYSQFTLAAIALLAFLVDITVGLIIVRGSIPENAPNYGKKISGISRIWLFVIFLIALFPGLVIVNIYMLWSNETIVLLYAYWLMAIAVYSSIKGGPLSHVTLKQMMVVLAILTTLHIIFLGPDSPIGKNIQDLRFSSKQWVGSKINSWARKMDGETLKNSPRATDIYVLPAGTTVYFKVRFKGGKWERDLAGQPVAADTVLTRPMRVSRDPKKRIIVIGAEEIYLVMLPNKYGKYTGELWWGISRTDLRLESEVLQTKADSVNNALAAADAKRQKLAADSLAQYQPEVTLNIATSMGDSVVVLNKSHKQIEADRGGVDSYFVWSTDSVATLVASAGNAGYFRFLCPEGIKVVSQKDVSRGKKNKRYEIVFV